MAYKSEKMSLDELCERTQQIIDDTKYDMLRMRSPRSRRQAQAAIEFWTAIHEHLSMYRTLLKDSTID